MKYSFRRSHTLYFILFLLIVFAAAWGPIVSNVEQARYTVIESDGNIEVRDYSSMIVAETVIKGQREQAINSGFRKIADFIFGNNTAAQEVAMTAPVTQMRDGQSWIIRFVMPYEYSMETLPKPKSNDVVIKKIAESRFAVIHFSGRAGKESLEAHLSELNSYIATNKLKANSEPTYAFFNPPWTLPFFRRNEIMIQIDNQK